MANKSTTNLFYQCHTEPSCIDIRNGKKVAYGQQNINGRSISSLIRWALVNRSFILMDYLLLRIKLINLYITKELSLKAQVTSVVGMKAFEQYKLSDKYKSKTKTSWVDGVA